MFLSKHYRSSWITTRRQFKLHVDILMWGIIIRHTRERHGESPARRGHIRKFLSPRAQLTHVANNKVQSGWHARTHACMRMYAEQLRQWYIIHAERHKIIMIIERARIRSVNDPINDTPRSQNAQGALISFTVSPAPISPMTKWSTVTYVNAFDVSHLLPFARGRARFTSEPMGELQNEGSKWVERAGIRFILMKIELFSWTSPHISLAGVYILYV